MTATAASLNEVFPGIEVIDCDAHYTEPADLWTSRAPASLRSRVPQMRRVNDRDMWFVDGDIPLGPVGFSVIRKNGEKAIGQLFLPQWELIHEALPAPDVLVPAFTRASAERASGRLRGCPVQGALRERGEALRHRALRLTAC